eukprot:TRINITY_DN4941_c0_g1_i11.p1 TRINITY_DN4941_c0_g1~~TRINITY_DN4941_c0_g1_i11.p1  ORF type:complete len:326 (-),score=54.17 TRINITY_DN4941_c0_g1_i11:2660-3637(-)
MRRSCDCNTKLIFLNSNLLYVMMGDGHHQLRGRSWGCTLFTQIALCISLYMAFYMGDTLKFDKNRENAGRDHDLYFLSVCGGKRPLEQQTHLLKLMEKVAKIYKVKFVVTISEHGEDDPFYQNGTSNFPSLKVPWYTTKTSQGEGMGYFLKQIMLPHGQILDIIGLDTGSIHDFLHSEQLSNIKNNQLHWLKTLALSISNWRLVVGYHPLLVCKEQEHTILDIKVSESLHQIFLQYRVNAYLSKQGCSGRYIRDEGIAYIGNPDPTDKSHIDPLENGTSSFLKGMLNDGFLLHRVSPLEIVSYFIDSASKVIFKSSLHQRGREVM